MSDESEDKDAELTRELRRLGRMAGRSEEEAQALTARRFYLTMVAQESERADKERQRAENAERRLRQYAALETYRRRHARNPKITLKQVCEDLGLNYSTVRSLKCRVAQRKKAGHSANTRVLQSGTTKRKKPIQ